MSYDDYAKEMHDHRERAIVRRNALICAMFVFIVYCIAIIAFAPITEEVKVVEWKMETVAHGYSKFIVHTTDGNNYDISLDLFMEVDEGSQVKVLKNEWSGETSCVGVN